MRKSDIELKYEQPMRQSYVAILMIIYKFYKIIVRQLWPFLIVFLVGKGSSGYMTKYIMPMVIVLSVLSMIMAILNFFKFYFYIKDDELHVSKGVFKKQRISIPLKRVQTVNFEENLVHRIFSVTSLKIDTAGSQKKEFDLDAIGIVEAEAIRDFILKRKAQLQVVETEYEDQFQELKVEKVSESLITRLSNLDLLKIGITYNHLRSGGLILAGMFWIGSEIDQLQIFDLEMGEEEIKSAVFRSGIYIFLAFVLAFVILSFLYSLIRTIFKYYNLSFFRRGKGFKIISGLVTRQEFSALDPKIQMISWKDNWLQKKIFGIFDVNLKQAGSIAINSKKSIYIPGLKISQISDILNYYIPGKQPDDIRCSGVDIKLLYRQWMYLALGFIPFIGGLFYFGLTIQGVFVSALFLFLGYSLYRKYWKIKFGLGQDLLVLKGGTFGDEHVLLKDYKVQAVEIKQSYYQRRHQLASVKIHTASGNISIPYIPISRAQEVNDFLLYKVEKSTVPWM